MTPCRICTAVKGTLASKKIQASDLSVGLKLFSTTSMEIISDKVIYKNKPGYQVDWFRDLKDFRPSCGSCGNQPVIGLKAVFSYGYLMAKYQVTVCPCLLWVQR